MKRLPVLMLLLLIPSPAHATLITGYAMGQVTQDRLIPGSFPKPRSFWIGEGVYLRFAFDLDVDPRRIDFDLITSGGYHTSVTSAFSVAAWTVVLEDGDDLRISLGLGPRTFDLRFVGDVGTLTYDRDIGGPGEGLRASLLRVPDASGFPIPEPDGRTLAVTGAVLVGLWKWRRG